MDWPSKRPILANLTKQLIAGVMSALLVAQPTIARAQLAADPNAGVNNGPNIGKAPNGIPSIDIAKPNNTGLSHNKYKDFNIENPGVILNNYKGEVGISQLGGVMPGNPNLRNANPASVILNEVTSSNRSALSGPAEVFGQKANVIIANPNGITCDGCGFINTPRATLTTGVPQIDGNGRLTGFDVRNGNITFSPKGSNMASGAGSVDILDIVSRTVTINGPVAGHDISITAGTGKYDYASREMKELYDISGKPEYAIDGSELGALQADKIKVIATEKGVGVRMRNDMAANAGQLTLSADGKLSLNNVSGHDGVKVVSHNKKLTAKKIISKQNVDVQAREGVTIETISADGDLMVNSGMGLLSIQDTAISGAKLELKSDDAIQASQVASGKDISIEADKAIDILVAVANGKANLHSKNGDIQAKNGIKATGGDLNITADSGTISANTLISFNNLSLNAGSDINITGNAIASKNINSRALGSTKAQAALAGQDIHLDSQGSINVSTLANGLDFNALNNTGDLNFVRTADLSLSSKAGDIVTDNVYSTHTIDFSAQQNTVIRNTLAASSNISIFSGALIGNNVVAGQALIGNPTDSPLDSKAKTTITTLSGNLQLEKLLSGGSIVLTANKGSISSKQLQTLADLTILARNGSIAANQYYAEANVHLNALNTITVDGQSYSGGEALYEAQTTNLGQATVKGNLTINSASITANNLTTYASSYLSGQNIDLQSLLAANDIVINTGNVHANRLVSGLDFDKTGQTGQVELKNYGKTSVTASGHISIGQAISADTLTLLATNDIEYNQLLSYKDAILKSDQGRLSLENTLIGVEGISLSAQTLDFSNNRAQNLKTAKTLNLNAGIIDFSNSTLSYGGLIANAWNVFNVQNANLTTNSSNGGDGDIKLTLPSLITDANTKIIADHDLTINTSSTVDNYGSLAAFHDLNITSSDVNNYAKLQSQNNLLIRASGNLTNHSQGLIYAGSNGSLFVNGALLNNFGTIMSQADLQLANYDGNGKNTSVTNKAGFIQAGQNLSILTQYLLNNADGEPTFTTETKEEKHNFILPEQGERLQSEGKSDMRGRLFFDPKKSPAWGAGGCRDGCDVTWLQSGIWLTKEQTYGHLTLPDGTIYKAFTWNYVDSNDDKGKVWYDWNSQASMLETVETQYFTNKPTKRGLIQANNNMIIDANHIDNFFSDIEAGGNASIVSNHLVNKGQALTKTKFITCSASGETCYAYNSDGSRNSALDLSANSRRVIKNEIVDVLGSTIKAGGHLTMNIATIENTAKTDDIQGGVANYEAVGKSVDPIQSVGALPGGLFTTTVDLNHLQKQNGTVNITAAIARGDIPTPKTNSGGFGGTLPHQYFIYETRADFLDIGKFYGSSYYLNHIVYKPDHQLLFLGDAYFENQLIDKQMRELVGQGFGKGSFVPGNDPISQMKSLLDAGADYSSEHNLAFGEPLSAEQVASLDKSIVVYVKQNVNGAEVYAPVLYVSAKDRASVKTSGAVIQGGSVDITTDNITHSGLIASNSDLRLNANDILSNGGGFAAKGNMQLASTGRIELNAGTTKLNGQDVIVPTQAIDAGGAALLSSGTDLNLNGVGVKAGEDVGLSGRNVNIGTAKTNTADGSENLTGSDIEAGKNLQVKADRNITVTGSSVHAGDQLAMSADKGNLTIQSAEDNRKDGFGQSTTQQKSDISSVGNMRLSSGENVVIAGSEVKSGGSLGIDAGKNIAIVSTQDKASGSLHGNNSFDTTKQQSSNVSAGKDMGIKAGEDILVGASHLNAGGNGSIEASGNINVIAMSDTDKQKTSGSIYKADKEDTKAVGSSITTGGNLTAIAGEDGQAHDLNIVGSEITADGKIGLKATNDVNILASEDTHYLDSSFNEKSSGPFGKKTSKTKHEESTTTNSSSVLGKNGVNIQSGNNTTISASDIMAGTGDKTADLNINVGGNLVVASGKDIASNQSNSKTKGFAGNSSNSKNVYDEKNVATNLGASGNINTHSDGLTVISGSNAVAGNDINMDGSSVTIMGAQENHSFETKKKSTGFGTGSGDGFYAIYGSEGQEKKSERTDNKGSQLKAGHDINVNASDTDVNVIGSTANAGHDINVNAARDINVTPGHESRSESEKKTRSGIGIQLQTSNTSASIGIGYGKGSDTKSEDHSTNSQSQFNAGNDINMHAERDINSQAGKYTAGRDANFTTDKGDINFLAANNVSNYDEMHKRLFAGVTATVGSGAASAVQDMNDAANRFGNGSGSKGLSNIAIAGANGYGAGRQLIGAYKDLQSIQQGQFKDTLNNGNLINGSITAGFNKEQWQSSSTSSTPVVNDINVGRSINVISKQGSIYSSGTDMTAGTNPLWALSGDDKAGDVNFLAKHNIYLGSAIGSNNSSSNSHSSGAQVGFDQAISPTGSAYDDKGKSSSQRTYHKGTIINATGDFTAKTEDGDFTLDGSQAHANKITADINGNLNIITRADTETVNIDHKTISGGFGSGGVSLDYTQQKANGKSNTVPNQAGLYAGDGGNHIKVADNTNSQGGAIVSSAPAEKNEIQTGTITWSDTETGSEWKASTSGIGGTIGTGGIGAPGSGPLVKPTLTDKGKDQGSAKATISPGQIIITDPEKQKELEQSGVTRPISEINRDPAKANDVIKGLPDLQSKLNDQLKTQQDWSKASATMATTVRDIADKLHKQPNDIWDEGGAGRAALHAIAGALLGGVNGVDGAIKAAIGAGVSTAIAPYINDIVKNAVAQSGLKGEDAKRLSDTLTSSIVSALLASAGGSNGAGYASNEMKYNYLTGEQLKEIEKYFECETREKECSHEEMTALQNRFDELQKISVEQTNSMIAVCYAGPSEACSKMIADAKRYISWYKTFNYGNDFRVIDDFDHTKPGEFGRNLDDLLVDAYSRGLYGDDALKYVNEYTVRYNSTISAIGDAVGVAAGIAGCIGSGGTGCVIIGGALAGLSANRLIQDGAQIVTGEEQLSLIEQQLVKTGLSKQQASNILNMVEAGTAVIAINQAGIAYVTSAKNGTVLAIAKTPLRPGNSAGVGKLVKPTSNPGTAQSRVNVAHKTMDNGHERGFDYAMSKHGANAAIPGKSQYTISDDEVRQLLQSEQVVKAPVSNPSIDEKIYEDRFVRQVDTGRIIGVDRNEKNPTPTSMITVITDRQGNLINTFPGPYLNNMK